jgi:hypothetical protein
MIHPLAVLFTLTSKVGFGAAEWVKIWSPPSCGRFPKFEQIIN